jgi:hypothetical protein
MARIYISSTYEDLEAERRAVRRAILRLGHHPVSMEDYPADSRPALERCVVDVRSCDGYVGIVGWRYGHVPETSGGLSITHCEYRTARDSRLPCYLFLAPELEVWPGRRDSDLALIRGFRRAVQAEVTTAVFRDCPDLVELVMASLAGMPKAETGASVPMVGLLPYTCDREEQVGWLHQMCGEASGQAGVWLTVLHGRDEQALSKFVDCIEHRHLAAVLAARADVPVKAIELPWPPSGETGAFRLDLQRRLAIEACGDPRASLEQVGETLGRLAEAVLISVRFPARDQRKEHRALLDVFARFWLDFPLAAGSAPVLVVLYAEYLPRPAGFLRRMLRQGEVTRRNREIREALAALGAESARGSRGGLCPELEDVSYNDVVVWARTKEVRRLCAHTDLEDEVREFYGDLPALPMRPLARRLGQVLQRHLGQRDS